MANLNIDTTSQQYQNLVAGLPILQAHLATRAPLLRRLAKRHNKDAMRAWLNADPLLKDFLRLVKKADKLIMQRRTELESEL